MLVPHVYLCVCTWFKIDLIWQCCMETKYSMSVRIHVRIPTHIRDLRKSLEVLNASIVKDKADRSDRISELLATYSSLLQDDDEKSKFGAAMCTHFINYITFCRPKYGLVTHVGTSSDSDSSSVSSPHVGTSSSISNTEVLNFTPSTSYYSQYILGVTPDYHKPSVQGQPLDETLDAPIDESDLDADEVTTVMIQANVSRNKAIQSLRKHINIVDAILDLVD